ncbi:MAG: acyl-CoA dehydrogenase [Desulfobacterales bacterium]|nr:acyl-CoA dehydrogenase [Desulfobacterales bacterium]
MEHIGYTLTEDQLSLRNRVRELVNEFIRPKAEEINKMGEFPWDIFEIFKKEDLLGMSFPKKFGGTERGALGCALVLEEISKACTTCIQICGQPILGAKMIVGAGNDEQKAKYLPMIAKGEIIPAVAMTEPDAGSDSGALRCRAVRKGDEYVINGSKIFITNADVAGIFTAFAKTDPEKGRNGISAFIIDRDAPGLTVGPPEEKMGSTVIHTSEVIFEDCVVPKENLVGEEGEGFNIGGRLFGESRYLTAARAIGLAQGVLAFTVKFINDKGINSETVNSTVAEMVIKIEAGRQLLYKACSEVERKSKDSRARISIAKFFCSNTAVEVAISALDIVGKDGYTSDYPIERFMCDAKITQIAEGTNQIQCAIITGALSRGELWR